MQSRNLRTHEACELATFIAHHLVCRIQGFELIQAADGLILRGRSASYYGKQMAQHVVMNATSLPILANEIQVYSLAEPGGFVE